MRSLGDDDDDLDNQPLLAPVPSHPKSLEMISSDVQLLSSYNHQLERAIDRLTRKDSYNARKDAQDIVAQATTLSQRIGQALGPASRDRNIEKLRQRFALEVKRLSKLTKNLAAIEKSILPDDPSDSMRINMEDMPSNKQVQGFQQQYDVDGHALVQRNAAIQDIGRDVKLLNDMMKDLAFLVEEQQEMVDSIASNVEKGKDSAEKGESELIYVMHQLLEMLFSILVLKFRLLIINDHPGRDYAVC
jgi:hypothetical protein